MTSSMHLKYSTHIVVWTWRINCKRHIAWRTALTNGGTRFSFFLLDMAVINMFLIYLAKCKKRSQKLVTLVQFRVELCEVLLQNWVGEILNFLGVEVFVILYL